MSVAIYIDKDDVKNLDNIDHTRVFYYSYETQTQFIQDSHEIKIAFLEPDYNNLENFEHICKRLSFCDLVVVQSMELFYNLYLKIRQLDQGNFIFVINGIFNKPMEHARTLLDTTWFQSTAFHYLDDLNDLCQQRLFPFVEKPYKFDTLFGLPTPHRRFVYNFLSQYNDHDWFYQSPFFNTEVGDQVVKYNLNQSDFWEDDMIVDPEQKYRCQYHGIEMNLSQVLPFKVYKKTSFSLVCETEFHNDFSFFTEKIVKPMLGYRMFIVISGQHYLKNLRSLGFKTFDTVIDETYDTVQDNEQRWTQALEQAVWLCKQDFQSIMKKITPIVLHNRDVLKNLNRNHPRRQIEEFLLNQGYHKKS
jgi:hypothetical protein